MIYEKKLGSSIRARSRVEQRHIYFDHNQPHILKYSMENENSGVRLHHDNCDLTVNLMMSKKDEYDGGG